MSTTFILPDGCVIAIPPLYWGAVYWPHFRSMCLRFQYLAPAFVSTIFLLFGQNIVVSRHRKRAGIAYPQSM